MHKVLDYMDGSQPKLAVETARAVANVVAMGKSANLPTETQLLT